ncbi:enoyl-CoA hydratase/isomerase family protein [Pseudomonas sp. IT-P176]|uniref:enoyl-CoA hydratase/isomerase family protein n=1 Tax=Pseudomonas sp. IT-P176 TaxID=3026444 RepID=UPI0039E01645
MAIQFKIIEHVALVTLDAPHCNNALTIGDLMHLRKTLRACQDDEQVRVIVLLGAGERAFCCGAHFKESLRPVPGFVAGALKSRETEAEEGGYNRLLDLSDLDLWKPLIAGIQGLCLGGGLELALQCDLRIATDGASFGLPEVRMAAIPSAGGVQYLLRAVGSAHAMKMALTGEPINAQEALRIGLVSDLVPAGQLQAVALQLAERIAGNGPLAVQSIKQLAVQTAHLPARDFVSQANLHWGLLRDSQDFAEGRLAFAQTRAPKYTGT